MKAGKILIVEDDPLWQEFLQEPLAETYHLTVVSNRAEAETVLRHAFEADEPFDVVTVDIGLEHDVSKLEGEDILALVSQHHSRTKCIVVSGHQSVGTTKLRNYFKEFDVFDYVSKAEFDLHQFKAIVDKAFQFHGYHLIEEVGRGGMGVVYKAIDPAHDQRVVAIKVMHSLHTLAPDAATRRIARFTQEVEAVSNLDHPHIVKVYDYSAATRPDDDVFFVMEYLDGQTLEHVLKQQGVLSVPRAVKIALQLCDALQYAHANHTIHRDIKPSNVILLAERYIKVTDFSIAKVLDTNSTLLTQTEEIVGTLDYMPPEQILRTKTVDARVDLYAVGAILYEMLAGQKPYDDAMLKLQAPPTPLDHLVPDLPPALVQVVMRAIASDPDLRYQTAAEMIAALQAVA